MYDLNNIAIRINGMNLNIRIENSMYISKYHNKNLKVKFFSHPDIHHFDINILHFLKLFVENCVYTWSYKLSHKNIYVYS